MENWYEEMASTMTEDAYFEEEYNPDDYLAWDEDDDEDDDEGEDAFLEAQYEDQYYAQGDFD